VNGAQLTVVIIALGFFTLMGWIAYLDRRYKNKPEDKP
jgi:hypothetical protein